MGIDAPGSPDKLSVQDVQRVVTTFRDALRTYQSLLNRLNVYPVPDGDTGTNMALTLESVVTEMEGTTDLASVCRALSHGSLMGARGNSGVILCQILRGFASEFLAAHVIDGHTFARSLASASASAYGAVMRPVEGTILTVVRESSEAALGAADRGAGLAAVSAIALEEARASLLRTPDLLPALRNAGVVDAGGAGFVLLLDSFVSVLTDSPVTTPYDLPLPEGPDLTQAGHGADHGHGPDFGGDLRYEVMYFLEAPDESITGFRDVWAGLGDSIVVVGGEGLWNCHIHTDDIGAAIEAGIECGRPQKIRVTDLQEQVEEERWVREGVSETAESEPDVTTAVVAVATGDGVRRIFRSLGVHRLVAGGQSMNPSVAQILEAVEAAPAQDVVILPNNKNIVAVAEQVGDLTEKSVAVVATTSVAEGFAALIAYDPDSDAATNAEVMRDQARSVLSCELTRAVRDADTAAGAVQEGDWIGLTRQGVKVIGTDLADTACRLLHSVLADSHSLITLIEGEGASTASTRKITEWLGANHSRVEVEVHHGGQPLYPYFFGVE